MTEYDVIVIGAGAAGLFCAAIAGQRGKRVLVIDHASVIGEKIRISGGGRCNFTNIHSAPNHFLSMNPHFVKSALSKFPPKNFIDLIKKHQIPFHEKHKGQLFCDDSATQIVDMLLNDCQKAGVTLRYPESVQDIKNEEENIKNNPSSKDSSESNIKLTQDKIAQKKQEVSKKQTEIMNLEKNAKDKLKKLQDELGLSKKRLDMYRSNKLTQK